MNARIGFTIALLAFSGMTLVSNVAHSQANVPPSGTQSPRIDKISAPDHRTISAPDHRKKKVMKATLPHHDTDPNEGDAVPEAIFVDKSWLVSEEASLTKIVSALVRNDRKTMSLLKTKLDKKKTPFSRISLLTKYIENLTKQ